jgi:radical SAM superfamily enzyme YgiQ (UPF0313 family)
MAIHKNIHHADILHAAARAAQYGFPELKLYFMIGLPGEEDEDIQAIVLLVEEISRVFGGRVLVSAAPFVPKAHTPFERQAMAPAPVLRDRLRWLQRALQAINARMTSESVDWAVVQAILARGDRQVSLALATLQEPSLSNWKKALHAYNLPNEYYIRARQPDERLPWSFIHMKP